MLVHVVHEIISTVPVLRANFVREPSTPVLLAAEPAVKTHVNRHVTSDRKAAIAAAAVAGTRCALAILLQQARRQVEWRAWPRRRRGKQCRGQHVGAMSRRCPARHMQYRVCCLNDRLGPADAQSELRRAGHEATWSAVVVHRSFGRVLQGTFVKSAATKEHALRCSGERKGLGYCANKRRDHGRKRRECPASGW